MNKKAIIAELSKEAETYRPTSRPWSKDDVEILRMFYGKVSADSIAKRLGRTRTAVERAATRNGIA